MNEWLLSWPEWLCRLLQPGEENRRWRELSRRARAEAIKRQAIAHDFWEQSKPVSQAGCDAYYRDEHAEADRAFEELLRIAANFHLHDPGVAQQLGFWGLEMERLPASTAESARWWQARIAHRGSQYWNSWRQAHPEVTPDLRGRYFDVREGGFNFSRADLRKTIFLGILFDADFSDANLEGASFSECSLNGADFRGANLTQTGFYDTDLPDADFTGSCPIS